MTLTAALASNCCCATCLACQASPRTHLWRCVYCCCSCCRCQCRCSAARCGLGLLLLQLLQMLISLGQRWWCIASASRLLPDQPHGRLHTRNLCVAVSRSRLRCVGGLRGGVGRVGRQALLGARCGGRVREGWPGALATR